jgi:hypothetical protein
MMKDLIQNKFGPPSYPGTLTASNATNTPQLSQRNTGLRPPSAKQSAVVADLKSRMSDKGDLRKNSDRLRIMLPKVHYPQPYNEVE